VLFGGKSAAGVLNDTWEWDGLAWTQQQDTGPSPRWHHALAFDLVHNLVVLFGGDPGNGNALGDTWSWDGSTWTQITTFGANPRFNAAMVSTDVQIALFGGTDSSNAVFRETWTFDGKHWTHRQDIGPVARFSHAMSLGGDLHCAQGSINRPKIFTGCRARLCSGPQDPHAVLVILSGDPRPVQGSIIT
jgi:hypothetical protein